MFVKRGDAKIVDVINAEDLDKDKKSEASKQDKTTENKKSVKLEN